MSKNSDHLKYSWDQLAQRDALWAVLTDDDGDEGKWNEEEFFKTGNTEIDKVFAKLSEHSISIDSNRALDFGCGVGRLTQALSKKFEHVTGVDIAPSMITQAKRFAKKRKVNSSFYLNEAFFDQKAAVQFDFCLSLITLQHIDPDLTKEYIEKIYSRLKPAGVFVLQLPAFAKGKEAFFQWLRHSPIKNIHLSYLKFKQKWLNDDFLTKQMLMKMNGIRKDEMITFLDELGFEILAIEEDTSAGPDWQSYLYIVRK